MDCSIAEFPRLVTARSRDRHVSDPEIDRRDRPSDNRTIVVDRDGWADRHLRSGS